MYLNEKINDIISKYNDMSPEDRSIELWRKHHPEYSIVKNYDYGNTREENISKITEILKDEYGLDDQLLSSLKNIKTEKLNLLKVMLNRPYIATKFFTEL